MPGCAETVGDPSGVVFLSVYTRFPSSPRKYIKCIFRLIEESPITDSSSFQAFGENRTTFWRVTFGKKAFHWLAFFLAWPVLRGYFFT